MTQSEPMPPAALQVRGAPSRARWLKLCGGVLAVLALVAEAGALAAFGLARMLGGAALSRWFGKRLPGGLSGSQGALMGIVFASRLLLFISFDLISYAAGLTALSWWRFALATLAGIVPASFVLAHLGFEMTSGETDQFLYTALALGLLTAIPIAVTLVRDRMRRRGREPE